MEGCEAPVPAAVQVHRAAPREMPLWNRGDRILDTFHISIPFERELPGYRVSGQIEMSDYIDNLS